MRPLQQGSQQRGRFEPPELLLFRGPRVLVSGSALLDELAMFDEFDPWFKACSRSDTALDDLGLISM